MPPTKLTEQQIAEAHERWCGGESFRDIGAEMGINRVSLWRLTKRRYTEGKPLGHWGRTLYLPDDPGTLGYIAGIVDGEGHISKIDGEYRVVRVRMVDREVIEYLASFGGGFHAYRPQTDGRQPTFEWNVARRYDVQHLLENILPYMRLDKKRELAKHILAKFD